MLAKIESSAERFQRAGIFTRHVVRTGRDKGEIAQQSVAQRINPTVDGNRLAAAPRVAHNRRLADVSSLLDHVQLAESIGGVLLRSGTADELSVTIVNILHVAEPVIDESKGVPTIGRLDPAAAVVAADDYV